MLSAVDAAQDVALRTQPTPPIDPRPPGIRLMLYRANIADWSMARAIQCDAAWFDLENAPVRLNARQELDDLETDESDKTEETQETEESTPIPPPLPPPPPGRVELVKARLAARGPSCLRREVRPQEEVAAHHPLRQANALHAGGSPLAAGGRKAGLYGARRGPATATPRAPTTPSRAPSKNERPAGVSADAAPPLPMDVDEEPARIARPMGRALSVHLYGKPPSLRSDDVPAAAEPMELAGGQTLLKRKRGGAEDADTTATAPPAKRLAEPNATQGCSTPGCHSAESVASVGRHVHGPNNTLPSPGSRAPSGTPGETETRNFWRRWVVSAWTAAVHVLAMVTARLAPRIAASTAS